MQLFEELKQQIDKVWEPVLCPVRTPISQDLLGGEYVSLNTDIMFRRHDQKLKTFDQHDLEFSLYLKINDRLRSIINLKQSSDFMNPDGLNHLQNDFQIDTLQSNSSLSYIQF
jgi:hypothetical protein